MGPTGRLYLLGLGNQQGKRHVYWHLIPLLLGVPYEEQQLATFSMSRGLLSISPEDVADVARQIRARGCAQVRAARWRARPLSTELQAVTSPWRELLSKDNREVLAHNFGLDGRAPRTLAEVARELKRSEFRVTQDVRRAVTLLLGPQAVPPELGGRATMACAVCGAPVELPPSLGSKAREHTCSCA